MAADKQSGVDFLTSLGLYGGIFLISFLIFCFFRPRFPLFYSSRSIHAWKRVLSAAVEARDPEKGLGEKNEKKRLRKRQRQEEKARQQELKAAKKHEKEEEHELKEMQKADAKGEEHKFHPELYQQENPEVEDVEYLIGEDGVDEEQHPHSFADDVPLTNSFFGWIGPTIRFPLDRIQRERGIESATYVRFLETTTILFLILTLLAFVTVVPTNAAGGNQNLPDADPLKTEGLDVINMGNIPKGSGLFWVHAVMAVIFVIITLLYLAWDYSFSMKLTNAYRTLPLPQNSTVMIDGLNPRALAGTNLTEKAATLMVYFEARFNGLVEAVHLTRRDVKLNTFYTEFERDKLAFAKECQKKQLGLHERKSGCCGRCGPKVDYYTETEDNLYKSAQLVTLRQSQKTADINPVAFVTFKTVETAREILLNKKTYNGLDQQDVSLKVSPQRGAVNWNNLHLSRKNRLIRSILVNVAVFFVSIFWSIPVAFVQTLGHLREIAKNDGFGWLNDVLDFLGKGIETLLNSALPALFLVLLIISVPIIIRLLSIREGRRTMIGTERAITQRYIFFLFVTVLFVSTIAGSFFDKVGSIFNGETSVTDLLATSFASRGDFFVSYLLVLAGMVAFAKLLAAVKFIIKLIKDKTAKTLVEKILTHQPAPINFPVFYAKDMIVFTVTLCFSVLNPFILPFGLAYFGISYLTSKYNVIYSTRQRYETEGYVWRGLYGTYIAALIIFQLMMIGIFGLQDSHAYILMIISVIVTAIAAFIIWLHVKHQKFPQLSFLDYTFADWIYNRSGDCFKETKTTQIDPAHSHEYYRQPVMVPVDE